MGQLGKGTRGTPKVRSVPAAVVGLVLLSSLVGLSILQMAFSTSGLSQTYQEASQRGAEGTQLELSYLPPHITGAYQFHV